MTRAHEHRARGRTSYQRRRRRRDVPSGVSATSAPHLRRTLPFHVVRLRTSAWPRSRLAPCAWSVSARYASRSRLATVTGAAAAAETRSEPRRHCSFDKSPASLLAPSSRPLGDDEGASRLTLTTHPPRTSCRRLAARDLGPSRSCIRDKAAATG